MRAASYDRVGAAQDVLAISTVATPHAQPGQLLVRIHASGVNPSDVKRRAGWRSNGPLLRPIIPHSDGAGIVEAVGDGVSPAWIGRRVWVWSIPGKTFTLDAFEWGTACESLTVPVENAVPLPDEASFDVGACLGIPACTAHYAIFADGSVAGLTILVQGGGGAVGECAIQFAKQAGATIIATAGSSETAKIARKAGADHVLDRRDMRLAQLITDLAPEGVDRIIELDFAANAGLDAAVIRRDGIIASYSSPSDPEPRIPYYALQLKGAQIRLISSYILPEAARHAAIAEITAMLRRSTLRPTIMEPFALENIAAAHHALETRAGVGQVVVRL
ncbi:NADPH:quinone reductase [Microvirga antarctica]|uniref:NADPH:quinone reductase n=1 Tax=Microvirga antarctica TaxID=2819233 RepID=UPI001B300671|nr:NADPH:quinone reductase [Microvirga antarctica]